MDPRLTYRTPDADALAALARAHRVDAAAPIQADAAIEIDAPPAKVWAVLTDVPNWAETLEPGVSRISLSDGVTVGSTLIRSNSGFRMRARFEVVDPERELAWTGQALGTRVVHRFGLSPTASGTRVACQESMGGRPAAILYSSAKLQASMEESLRVFKRACERP